MAAGREGSNEDLVALCHDLRQYVTAGRLLADLPDHQHLEEETRRRFGLIKTTFEHAATLLEQALEGVPSSGPVDLLDLVQDCVQVARIRHPVAMEVAQEPGVVGCESLPLHRAVDNMLDNAIRAAGPSGRILVRVGVDDGHSFVEVVDDGPGFARMPGASGHGLSVVAEAVQGCGGRLNIESGPGPGTTIRLTLARIEP
jgi:signal transduction histidine kinase